MSTHPKIFKSYHTYLLVLFSFFSGWLLSIPFEGSVLYTLIKLKSLDTEIVIYIGLFFHLFGLIIGGFVFKDLRVIKPFLVTIILILIFFTSLIYLYPYVFIRGVIAVLAFGGGLFISGFAYYLKFCFTANERYYFIADILIFSNLILTIITLINNYISWEAALFITIILLVIVTILAFFLPNDLIEYYPREITLTHQKALNKTMHILIGFVIIISVSSGLMYQSINPTYQKFPLLQNIYQLIPYLFIILILKRHTKLFHENYILYFGVSLLGFAFLSYSILPITALNYIIINSLLLTALGIYDLYWWNVLGRLLDFYHRPALLFGIGLIGNVLGIIVGEFISKLTNDATIISFVALATILIAFLVLPILSKTLNDLLKYFEKEIITDEPKVNYDLSIFEDLLTPKELEVLNLMSLGYSNKNISLNLKISNNTTKTHIKNIYQKLQVNSRLELIDALLNNQH